MDIEITNLALRHLLAEIEEIVKGGFLKKVQELPNNWLKMKFSSKQGSRDLIAAPNALFLTDYSLPAKQQSSGFGALLKARLGNSRVLGLKQHGFDRVAVMEFGEYSIVFELFAKGNLVLLKDEVIEAVYRRKNWKDRVLKKGEKYIFPQSKGISPEADFEEFKDCLGGGGIAGQVIRNVNIAPIIAEAACEKAGVEKDAEAGSLTNAQLKKIHSAINKFYSGKSNGKACVAEFREKKFLVPCCAMKGEEQGSFSSAIDSILSEKTSEGNKEDIIGQAHSKKIASLEKALEEQKAAVEKFEKNEKEFREKAEMIYQHYGGLRKLVEEGRKLVEEKAGKDKVMYKMNLLSKKVVDFDPKSKKLIVEIK